MKKLSVYSSVYLSIYLSVILLFSVMFFVSSCQKDIVADLDNKNDDVAMIDYRTDPGDWCDGGQSDPPMFYAKVFDESNGTGKIVMIFAIDTNTNAFISGLEDDMQLATSEFNFCTGTGNQQGVFYENPNTVQNIGAYIFHNVIPLGTHFAVEVLGSEENYDGCNVFPWEHDCP